jgi:hypothetical protein
VVGIREDGESLYLRVASDGISMLSYRAERASRVVARSPALHRRVAAAPHGLPRAGTTGPLE